MRHRNLLSKTTSREVEHAIIASLGRRWIAAGLAVLILGGWSLPGMTQAPPNSIRAKTIAAKPFSDVAVTVRRSAPARVISLNRAQIAAELNARILAVDVRVGDAVERDDTLVRLDCRDYEHALAESNARLKAFISRRELADRQLARTRALLKTRTVSEDVVNQRQSEVETSVADIAAQRALIDRAATNASRCDVKSPFAGIVTQRHAQVGEYTSPGTTLVEIVDIEHVELVAEIDNADAARVEQHGKAVFRYAGESYPASVRALLPVVNPITRSRDTRLTFDAKAPHVGATGRLEWIQASNAIPTHLVVSRGGRLGVFTVEDDKARFITADAALPGRPAVVNLPDGALVVTQGRQSLEDGDPIRLIDDNANPNANGG